LSTLIHSRICTKIWLEVLVPDPPSLLRPGGPEAVFKAVVVLALTDEQAEEATHELWAHKFFGLNRSNVILLVQVGGRTGILHSGASVKSVLLSTAALLLLAHLLTPLTSCLSIGLLLGLLQNRRAPYKYDVNAKAWVQVRIESLGWYSFGCSAFNTVVVQVAGKISSLSIPAHSRPMLQDPSAPPYPGGTGLSAMQLSWVPDAYCLNEDGLPSPIGSTALEFMTQQGIR
jgi:hypothetical protein